MSGDPLDPVRRILDHLADQTEPPCDPAVEVDAYWQAIHDISTYVYPEPTGMEQEDRHVDQ